MKEEKEKRIKEIENAMAQADFWNDKNKAQLMIKELTDLKDELSGVGKYEKGDAIMTIFSGAGGDDAEDFSRILFEMYSKFFTKKSWSYKILDESENDHGGYRNITLEISGNGVYGELKGESGVHRLVRLSPFNAKNLRQTSFSMVEVSPKIDKNLDFDVPESELKFEMSKAGGPGGQNVNKRETAVKVIHIPTNISVRSTNERSQAQNKEKAIQILKGKIFAKMEEEKNAREKGLYISKSTSIEWGNQIRSYVFHPYKMIKDHRTNVETSNIDKVLDGDLEEFVSAEKMI
ncbi:MAG: PCRF domain-containing protein [Candidatus Taylorbacteria bacterium]|nr:PCRF domain-containing protein [Candidatus Taylorbacteria bacterium]